MKDRIRQIIDYFQMNPHSFAQEIGVNRSTLSHILNGRNKPSVEFLQKILKRFPDISAHWLILGIGNIHTPLAEISPIGISSVTTTKDIDKIVVFFSDNSFEEFTKGK